MEKEEVGILIAFILGVFVIGFFGKFTGNVINNTGVECNIADINGDGSVDYLDKEDFGELYAIDYYKTNCSISDINMDGALNFKDSNRFVVLYNENYGTKTGECVQRKSVCEEKSEPNLIAQEQTEPFEEKLSFFQKTRDFFKNLFKK